jgi:hypothetical protein
MFLDMDYIEKCEYVEVHSDQKKHFLVEKNAFRHLFPSVTNFRPSNVIGLSFPFYTFIL